MLTKEITTLPSWQQAAKLLLKHEMALDHLHACALLKRVADLVAERPVAAEEDRVRDIPLGKDGVERLSMDGELVHRYCMHQWAWRSEREERL
jgi:hypothetical protein